MDRNSKTNRDKALLAFCHIEKAAGTTLIHILRRIFLCKYAAVRPLHPNENHTFTARDLKTVLHLNPFLQGIGGHSVVPYADLDSYVGRKVTYISQIRDPISRALSQYNFWASRLDLGREPEEFMKHPTVRNFQVKKIAGCENLDRAKEIISEKFLLIGTIRRFDEYLVLLANRLRMPLQAFTYHNRNVADLHKSRASPDSMLNELREVNQLDLQFYDWVEREQFPRYIGRYEGDFQSDLEQFRELQTSRPPSILRSSADYVYRNAYLKPLSGSIRVINGLTYGGSYAE